MHHTPMGWDICIWRHYIVGLTFKATGSPLDILLCFMQTSQVFLPVFSRLFVCGAPLLAYWLADWVGGASSSRLICTYKCQGAGLAVGKTALWSRFWPGHKFQQKCCPRIATLWTWIGLRNYLPAERSSLDCNVTLSGIFFGLERLTPRSRRHGF